MRMLVPNPRVSVPVAVGLSVWIGRRMVVLVMDIMDMAMLVLERFVQVLVVMRLGEVQIDTNPHEKCGADQGKSWRLAEQRQRKGCADKWSRREVGASARRSQVAEAEHKHYQTDAIAEKPDCRGGCNRCRSRQWRAMTERHREIYCAGGQSLDHGNLQRIGRAEPAGEIVVDAPRYAGEDDQHAAQLSRGPAPAPGQESKTAPARIAMAPTNILRSTFSRKTSQAIAIVARPSMLSRSRLA